jgi:hypothetical protein
MKLFFIIVEVALAIAFGVLNRTKMWNAAACVEWAIAFVYTFWVLSFVVDFLPLVDEKWAFKDETILAERASMGQVEAGLGHHPHESHRHAMNGNGTRY